MKIVLQEANQNEEQTIVIFVHPKAASGSDLNDYGIDWEQAAELRARLMPFAENWE